MQVNYKKYLKCFLQVVLEPKNILYKNKFNRLKPFSTRVHTNLTKTSLYWHSVAKRHST